MKTTLYIVSLIMTCLMLVSTADAATEAGIKFNLKATLGHATCNQTLGTSGEHVYGNTVYFGVALGDDKDFQTTRSVTLQLYCKDQRFMPFQLNGISFDITKGHADTERMGRLYPDGPKGTQDNLYYDLRWGKVDTNLGHFYVGSTGIFFSNSVNLRPPYYGAQGMSIAYNKTTLEFPIDITRKAVNSLTVEEGEYEALMTVTIKYE
ncbi:hypothetical protein CBX60_14860 [Salmonella enterica subsp. enterica serovar Pensacola]|nr:hypothetical protein [Salmonella enterica]ECT8865877.1 hypothetical protein [Salmonella enterica subsp. enterica serovar Pensacola]